MSLTHLLLRLLLGRRLPVTTGELRLRGPGAPATIRRDQYGVPHIDAETEGDAIFGLGFCQGQDRAAQLEVLWRVGRGRLSEWVGEAGLGADRISRRIGFRRAAERQLPVLAEGPRKQLDSFTAGINLGHTVGLTKKPHEFAIVGGEPSPWDPADVLTVLKLLSFSLASNYDVEIARLRILLADGPDALASLDPVVRDQGKGGQGDKESTEPGASSPCPPLPLSPCPPAPPLAQFQEGLEALRRFLPPGGGSNNWVIAGARTASGKPLLSNDPHLEPSAPPPWYLAHARCPEWEVAGACLAGAPGFPIGHNGFAAWGVTAGLSDNADLFIETPGPDGSIRGSETVRETIRVKGKPDVVEEVLVTPRGPVVTPLTSGVPLSLSLRAVWLDPLPVNGFFTAHRMRTFEEFRRCFDHWPILPLNVLYADANGATGYQLVGQVPRRVGGSGLLPRPADGPDSGWGEPVPLDEMPHATDFPAGFHATANNDPWTGLPSGAEPRPFLGADYCDPYRVRSITDALAAKATGWTVADCAELQRSVRSIPWEEIRDIVLSLTPTTQDSRDALGLLREWDGQVDSESPAACVFELFTAEMCVRVARANAPKSWQTVLGEGGHGALDDNLFSGRRVGHLVRLIREQPVGWFASWSAEMEAVLGEVAKKLRRDVGPGPAFWAWGHLRQLRVNHSLFKDHPWLGPAFNLGPVPCGGDTNTVSQAAVRPTDPTGLTHNIPNLRAVFDLADLAASRFVLCGGQSGNPWSDHHADQFPLWQAGESITIPWLQAEVIRAARTTMRLLPQG